MLSGLRSTWNRFEGALNHEYAVHLIAYKVGMVSSTSLRCRLRDGGTFNPTVICVSIRPSSPSVEISIASSSLTNKLGGGKGKERKRKVKERTQTLSTC